MAITNLCPGTGQEPQRTRVTPYSMGSRFGGKRMGCCPEEGCDARVTPNGRLAKHEIRPGEFQKIVAAYAAETPTVDPYDPRHLS